MDIFLKSEFLNLLKSEFKIQIGPIGGSIHDDNQFEVKLVGLNSLNMSSLIIETDKKAPTNLTYIYTEASFVDKDIYAITISQTSKNRWVIKKSVMNKYGKILNEEKIYTEEKSELVKYLMEFFQREETGITKEEVQHMSRYWNLENIV